MSNHNPAMPATPRQRPSPKLREVPRHAPRTWKDTTKDLLKATLFVIFLFSSAYGYACSFQSQNPLSPVASQEIRNWRKTPPFSYNTTNTTIPGLMCIKYRTNITVNEWIMPAINLAKSRSTKLTRLDDIAEKMEALRIRSSQTDEHVDSFHAAFFELNQDVKLVLEIAETSLLRYATLTRFEESAKARYVNTFLALAHSHVPPRFSHYFTPIPAFDSHSEKPEDIVLKVVIYSCHRIRDFHETWLREGGHAVHLSDTFTQVQDTHAFIIDVWTRQMYSFFSSAIFRRSRDWRATDYTHAKYVGASYAEGMERVFHGGEKAIRTLEADAMVYLTLQRRLPDMEWTLCDMAMEMEERGRKGDFESGRQCAFCTVTRALYY
ncbi:hypothetical protein BKA63DRAFT_609260 [Paraphoma chrysanthemicola]|nr:hypothetical protein BKA63DRAFT_609260 [Paraphoma chrysanthemicola]